MPLGSSQWMYATGAAVEGQSLRFNDDDSAYLSWEPASAGNRKTWTWSGWIKRGNITRSALFVSATTYGFYFEFNSSDQLEIYDYSSGAYQWRLATSQVFRDPSAWYHIVLSVDTTQTTSSDRVTLYVNGEEVTAFGTSSYPSLNWDTYTNEAKVMYLGYYNASLFFDGYMAEVNFVDGAALDPTSFGETDANGQWVPITEPSVSYGTNGFYLPFTNDYEVEGFNTVTWSSKSPYDDIVVSGVGFQPDLVWAKSRTDAYDHVLTDSVRGVGKSLYSSATSAETTNNTYGYLGSFDTDGFTGSTGATDNSYFNYGSGDKYVAWSWDMGTGSAASNTDGSITSSVKANPTYGQSIVSYTGNGSAGATIGHGLNSKPDFVIFKNRDTGSTDWIIYHSALTVSQYMSFDASAVRTISNLWDGMTSTVLEVDNYPSYNTNGDNHIAYCFHSVAGYSDFGSYSGTGASGNKITTGFAPAFVMIKNITTAGYWWMMKDNTRDPSNPNNLELYANVNNTEYTASGYDLDFESDGFTIDATAAAINGSGDTYIYMAFADKREAAFWLDQSGNNNDWTNNNMQESDISLDNPTNNFATLNPLTNTGGTFTEGNLQYVGPASLYRKILGTIGVSTGKWYWEVAILNAPFTTRTNVSQYNAFGFTLASSVGVTTSPKDDTEALTFADSGYYRNFTGSWTDGGTAIASGDVLACAVDLDAGTFAFKKNNVDIVTGSIDSSADGKVLTPFQTSYDGTYGKMFCNFGQDSSFAGNEVAQGNTDENGFGDFYYAPPAGYLALCTQNLSTPAIKDGSEHFNTVLYTGDATDRSITGIGFQPDFTWVKNRSNAYHHGLFDNVRGANKVLKSSAASAEATFTEQLTSFDTDGFSLGDNSDSGNYVNISGHTYVAWNWKADNTSGTSNTDGSITSTVSANSTAGFSIVSFTGTGSAATVGHGLSEVPQMVIVKNRADESDWLVYHKDSIASGFDAEDSFISLNGTGGVTDSATPWNNTAPTSSVFSVGTSNSTNGSSDNMIAYCFHGVEGYSKFGSYTGNGSSDGPFVYTGFRPAFVMFKRVDVSGNSWTIVDSTRNPYNEAENYLYPNAFDAEYGGSGNDGYDYLSNGFKVSNTYSGQNGSGGTIIYMAFAENPFKYSNAR